MLLNGIVVAPKRSMTKRGFGTVVGGALTMLAMRAWIRRARRFDFNGRSVVITGGSRGLGYELAREFMRHGANVTLLARDSDELERAARTLPCPQGSVHTLTCDLRDPAQIRETVEEIVHRRGGIDVLVNNAGVIQVGPSEHMSIEDFELAMALHFWAPLHAMREVVPIMKERGNGRIVNIASVGGRVAIPHLAPYCASKFALVGLSDAVRCELSKHGIYVTTVCPGLMRTGSHVNATIKGKHRSEFAWFATLASAPVLSQDAARAARTIVRACRDGRRAIDVGVPARLLAAVNVLAPSTAGELMAIVDHVLPRTDDDGDTARSGWESRGGRFTRWLTRRADRAVAPHNELRGHREAELRVLSNTAPVG